MRKRLVNQQLEPRRLNALAKIFLALFALLLTPNLAWAEDYQLWIGGTPVTDTNAGNVLGDGTVSFTVSGGQEAAPTYTLTLNGANLTEPVKVGLANLTIDIQGTNTITTNTTCIQNTAATGVPSLTFKSTSDVVGSLTLKNNDEEYTGVISESFYSNNTNYVTISRELALIMLRSGNYTSDTYYFTAGEVHDAQLVPSYGVQVGDMQVYEGNAADVLGDGKVSFDKTTNTLTLNDASTGAISTSLNSLTIELIGDNRVTEGASYPTLRSSHGDAVTITLHSTAEAKGSLTMFMPATQAGTFADGKVTLSIADPLQVVSGQLTDNFDNANSVGIGIPYDLWVNNERVTTANRNSIIKNQIDEGHILFDGDHTLTFNEIPSRVLDSQYPFITASMDLTINLVGDSNFDTGNSVFITRTAGDNNTHTLTFTTDTDNPGMLTISKNDAPVTFEGYTCVYENSLSWIPAGYYDESNPDAPKSWIAIPYAEYGLTVGGVAVTSANAGKIWGQTIDASKVSYAPGTKTLTLETATIVSGGITTDDDLTISVIGDSDVNGTITSTKSGGATLTFLHSDVNDASLSLHDFSLGDPSGFTSVVYDGMYLTSDNERGTKYNTTRQRFEIKEDERPETVYLSNAKTYDLWLGTTKVTDDNKNNILNNADAPTATFNPDGNILTLNGMNLTTTSVTKSGILSCLSSLTIVVNGNNTITCDDSCTAIRADLEGAQTLTIVKGSDDCMLTLNTLRAIRDFSSITLTGLAWDNNYTYSNNMLMKNETTEVGNCALSEGIDLWVEGIQVTSTNASNVLGGSPARVTFDAETNTLTLNGAYIVTSNSAGIKSGLANLNVVLSGGQSEIKCTGNEYYAFEGTDENATVTFSSSATSVGYLDITTAGYNKFFKDITPAYDGITHFDQTSVYTNEYYYHIRKSPWTGSGTENDPYLISTTTDLKTMSSYAYQGIVLNHYFKLNNDIDWSEETGAFNSIGRRYDNYRIFSFDGTFDGNNKTISNLTSENGLFNYVMNGGSIKNLTLTGCTVTGGSSGEDAAGLVADFRSSGKIENCSVKNSSITNNNYTNITSAGGIVGYMTNGTIDNCSIEDVTITMSGSPTYTQSTGGIVGHTYDNTTITNCEVKVNAGTTKITNTVENDKTLYAGAIVGWRERETTLTGNTYQAGVVVETRQGNNPAVTKSGNTQRGLGDGDDTDGAVLEGVKKITLTKNENGTVENVSGIYRVDGNDIYALPYSLSNELTVIKGTSAASYDEPTIDIKTATNSTAINPETAKGSSEGLLYAQWSFPMPDDDATASILFQINLAKEARNFVIANRDYTGNPLPVTEIKTTLDALDASNPAFIELQSGTHFNVTGYKDSQDVAIGTDAPTNAGNYKVVIEGIGDCTGTATISFVINRLAITPEITVTGWIYGSYDATENGPSLTEGSNPGNGKVTYYFKTKNTEEEFHEMELSSTTDAGTYLVIATVAETGNYEGGSSEEAEFVIAQLDISQADITLDNTVLTYNGEQQTVNVTKVMAGDIEVPVDCYEVSGNTEKEAGDYKLTVTAKTKDSQGNAIKNNFTGSAEKDWKIKNRTVTADELGLSENQTYATYFNNTESFDLPDGIVAYIITGVSGTTVTTKRISYIPKNVAVLVENGTSTEDAVDAATDNQLLGTADAKDVSTITGGAVYVLYKSEFVKTTTGTIPANRCYLVVSGGAGARSLSISHGEGNDTGIDNLVFDEDGTEKWYDLRGRRIEKPTKAGLYIRNGEKIVVNDNNK